MNGHKIQMKLNSLICDVFLAYFVEYFCCCKDLLAAFILKYEGLLSNENEEMNKKIFGKLH